MKFSEEFIKRRNILLAHFNSLSDKDKKDFIEVIKRGIISDKYLEIESWRWALERGNFDINTFNPLQVINMKAKLDTIIETNLEPPQLKEYDSF